VKNSVLSRWLFASLLMKVLIYHVIQFIENECDFTDDAKMMGKLAIVTGRFLQNLPSGSEENAKEY
jgi:hypothetical protein